MKKLTVLFMVALFMLGISAQAMAYFEDGDLIRVVYSSAGTMETATDLGSIASLTTPSGLKVTYNANNFSIASLGSGATAANSYVAYYSFLAGTPANAWTSGPNGGQTAQFSVKDGYAGAVHSVNGLYQTQTGAPAQVTVLMSDPNSYFNMLAGGGSSAGQFAGFIPAGNGEANLANLSSVGYVDQYIYYYKPTSARNADPTGLSVAMIRTYADGHTVMNPNAVPIPPSVLLLGSGLIGLIGIRRKNVA
jgi:hypothetical protein